MLRLILSVLLLLTIFIGCTKSDVKPETIKIGFIGPLTGDVSFLGDIDKSATEIAVEEINANGGVLDKRLRIIYEDGKCTGSGGLSAANKLVNIDDVKILLVSCGQEVLTVSPVAENKEVILFATYATHPDISKLGDFVFRNSYSDADIAEIASNTIIQKYKRIGLISEQTDYTKGLADAFKAKFEEVGGEIVEESFASGTTDFRGQLLKLKDLDAIFINPSGLAQGELILKQLGELGYAKSLYGNYFGGSNQIQQLSESQGMIFFSDPSVAENLKKQAYFDKYEAKTGKLPDLTFPAAARYDAVHILADAITFCKEVNSECVRDYLYDLKKYSGVLGTYGFDENGDLSGIAPSVSIIEDETASPYSVQ